MKKPLTSRISGGGKYSSPEIEIFESVVERGFEVSDEYYIYGINYGDENYAGAGFGEENSLGDDF